MAGEHLNARARRVIAGVNSDGRSFVVSDDATPARVATDACTINQIWQMDALPPHVDVLDSSGGTASITPPEAGFVYLVTTWPPDSEWDLEAGYRTALEASGNANAHLDSEIPGLHQTDTVDIITVVSGELFAVLEDGEVLLKQGDSFVQRGTKHSWSNRSDQPCTIVALMMSATR